MATTTRGRVLWDQPNRGRGTCPVCNRTGIKLLYERVVDHDVTKQVCKNCRSKKQLKKQGT
ncbi:hypothetical protein [Salisediminibacterium selenitireducens]|uniref:Uncharacterized protein n=1 Tax=Bacillus selenitireducens (strain ATCC 700615 / DSM 15326 / MLS10) TaxID=439292 RepID=D6XVZ8_BACIE|nr:hypothetical protein [Salisediminibacterium selenitireducens]ADH97771.1 hypothetical protein Bsel_0226 [[Bacillus] selenitireducens MLS10]